MGVGGWHRDGVGLTQALAHAFIVREKKGAILLDGSAEGAAELVLPEWRNSHTRPVAEEIVGVESGVPQKLIAYTVKLVRAGLGLDLHIGATGTPKFSGVVVVGNFEFLDGIH